MSGANQVYEAELKRADGKDGNSENVKMDSIKYSSEKYFYLVAANVSWLKLYRKFGYNSISRKNRKAAKSSAQSFKILCVLCVRVFFNRMVSA
jgi:hypothetical protein